MISHRRGSYSGLESSICNAMCRALYYLERRMNLEDWYDMPLRVRALLNPVLGVDGLATLVMEYMNNR